MLLDEELDQRRVALHGRVVETRPPGLRLGVDEGVAGEQGLAHLDAAVLGRQVERGLALEVEHVDPAVVLQEELESRSSIIESEERKKTILFFQGRSYHGDLGVTLAGGHDEWGPAVGALFVDRELDLA